jgi:hypothetical protein
LSTFEAVREWTDREIVCERLEVLLKLIVILAETLLVYLSAGHEEPLADQFGLSHLRQVVDALGVAATHLLFA